MISEITHALWSRDARTGLLIGLAASTLALPTLVNLGMTISAATVSATYVALSLLSWAGIVMGTVLSAWIPFLRQFSKFAVVGGLSTLLELAVLNMLFVFSGLTAGVAYTLFKALTFCIALSNSYLWNKHWSFMTPWGNESSEFGLFFVVNIVGVVINVGIASFVVNVIPTPEGFSGVLWGNIGAVAAVGVTMVWNFTMYRLVVFRSHA